MKNNILNKIGWFLFSFAISLIIWAYVTSTDGEEFKQTFYIPVQIIGEDTLRSTKNKAVTGVEVNTVRVEIVGPRRIVASLKDSDLVAEVDVSKLSQSAYTSLQYTVVFPNGIDVSNVSVASRSPQTVNFMVSELTTKTIQVRGSFDGSVSSDCTAETPVFDPSTITVSGPEAYLKNISYASVSFGEGITASSSYTTEVGYILCDEDGNTCSTVGINVSDDVITATLPILSVKEIPLAVSLIYGAGATEDNTLISIEPATISLAGDSALLSGINKIILASIDVSDFVSSYTDTYVIPIDNSLRNLSGVPEASVTVSVTGTDSKSVVISNISCINVTDGFKADIITQSLEVVLRGPADDISAISGENVRAVADLTDFNTSTGTYLPNVKIYVDGYPAVGAIGDYTISVELKRG